tara:strand:+ start:2249 stop:3046 length:798 start_codon:yes stop_codon:yes gene_type:complete
MFKNKIIHFLIIIFFSIPSFAEIVTVTGTHKHTEEVSKKESCEIALQKAKAKALEEALGEKVSSEVFKNCTEIDGQYNCQRNQSTLLSLNGDITGWQPIGEADYEFDGSLGICKITIEAEVTPINKNEDPTFYFKAQLDKNSYRSEEEMEIDIEVSKDMFVYVFQWLPYTLKGYSQITKVFPNHKMKQDNKNDNFIKNKTKLKFQVYFPNSLKNRSKVNEILIFIASEKEIPWFSEYAQVEDLKKQILKGKILMESKYLSYIVLK